VEGRREELLREAEEARLARGLRAGREGSETGHAGAASMGEAKDIEVRWGLLEDEAKIADLLQLNGMPRWAAFEERYVVAERDGEILAALSYRTEKERLLVGLLVSDPWAEERPLAVALYDGAAGLARELGVSEVVAAPFPRAEYPRAAGYHRRGRREWRLDVTRSGESRQRPVSGRWRRLFELFGYPAVPFFGAFSGRR
jgi:N-acetylglutamate synthase-like GNAT family acetyltransferase